MEPIPEAEWLVSTAELSAMLDLPGADPAELAQVCQAATAAVVTMLDSEQTHTTHAWDREAAGAVAVQIWGARQAPGGQIVGADLTTYASPHLLGPGLYARVRGLTKPCASGLAGGVVIA